jgi:hypothetical protein
MVITASTQELRLRRIERHMECRNNLDYRLIFFRDGHTLVFVFYNTLKDV